MQLCSIGDFWSFMDKRSKVVMDHATGASSHYRPCSIAASAAAAPASEGRQHAPLWTPVCCTLHQHSTGEGKAKAGNRRDRELRMTRNSSLWLNALTPVSYRVTRPVAACSRPARMLSVHHFRSSTVYAIAHLNSINLRSLLCYCRNKGAEIISFDQLQRWWNRQTRLTSRKQATK